MKAMEFRRAVAVLFGEDACWFGSRSVFMASRKGGADDPFAHFSESRSSDLRDDSCNDLRSTLGRRSSAFVRDRFRIRALPDGGADALVGERIPFGVFPCR